MDRKQSIGMIEHLLKTRTYTEQERNHIIDMTNKQWNTVYNKTDRKFQRCGSDSMYGLTLRRWYEDIIRGVEEKNYVV